MAFPMAMYLWCGIMQKMYKDFYGSVPSMYTKPSTLKEEVKE